MQVIWNLLTYVFIGCMVTSCTDAEEIITTPTITSEAYEPCCGIDTLRYQFGPHWVSVPNVFTPNGDGVNDVFRPIRSNDSLQINLFHVWGYDTLNNLRLLYGQQFLYWEKNETKGWNGIRYNVDDNRTPHRGKFDYDFTVYYQGKGYFISGSACAIICDEESKIFIDKTGCAFLSQLTANGDFDPKLPKNEKGCFE